MRSKHKWLQSPGWTVTVLLLVPLSCCTCVMSYFFVYLNNQVNVIATESAMMNDTAEYLVDFSTILDGEWEVDFNTIRTGREDILGATLSTRGSAAVTTVNNQHPNCFIDQSVTVYTSSREARARFYYLEQYIFSYYFGGRPDNNYWITDYWVTSNPGADNHHVACTRDINLDRCTGLFLYGNYIVLIDTIGAQHITPEDFIIIYSAVDSMMVSRGLE